MTFDLVLVLLLLAVAIAMLVLGKPRMDVVALLVVVALPLTGILSVNETLVGFSDPNVVLIALLFVIGEGLVRTGVARRLGDWIHARAGGSETRLLVLLMLAVGGLGSLMSSTAVVAIFIPVVLRICQKTGTTPSRLMMPLSFAALISGMLTLVATAPNLIVNSELVRQGAAGFHFFSFTVFGLPVLALGVLYMLVARHWLPTASPEAGTGPRLPTFRDWIEKYELAAHEFRARVLPGSPLLGGPLEELSLRSAGVNLLVIERGVGFRKRLIRPIAWTQLEVGDVLLMDVRAPEGEIASLRRRFAFELLPLGEATRHFNDLSQEMGMVEAIVPAESKLVGKTILEARVRRELGLTAIGLRRGRTVHTGDLFAEQMKVGDTLLLVGFWKDIERLRDEGSELIVLGMPAERDERLPAADKAFQALAVLALVVALMVSGVVPNVLAALIGALLMGLLGCLDANSAYRSVNWQSLVLIVGMMPFSIALKRTGGVDLAAEGLLGLVGEASPRVVLAALFVITAGLGLAISNTATAVLMAPVALAIASDLGASPYPFAMIVALAASTAFMTPVSSPVNTLVVGPGNYTFGDFVRVGVPFSALVLVVCVLLVPAVLPP